MTVPRLSKYKFRLTAVIANADIDGVRNAVKNRYDPIGYAETFSTPLSASGNLPAQSWIGSMPLRRDHLDDFLALANSRPKAWLHLCVPSNWNAHHIKHVNERFDLAAYRDGNWQTRTKAYVHIDTQQRSVEWVLNKISQLSTPQVTLQLIAPDL